MLAVREKLAVQSPIETVIELIGAADKSPLVRSRVFQKISRQMEARVPVQIVLPAFPAKSSNREKTMGVLPDLGEVLALQRLDNLCKEIQKAYSPGAEILICSDGRVFNDLVLVSDTAVNAYQKGISKIIADFSLTHLKTFNLDDVFSDHTYSEMRKELMNGYTSHAQIERSLFNGIHRFIFEDRLVLAPRESREKTRQEAKEIAYQVVERSQAWGKLVEAHFPDAVRLSIHPQSADSEKIGIRLLPSDNIWRTPWHSVVFVQGEKAVLIPRKEALARSAKVKFLNDEYGYFHA